MVDSWLNFEARNLDESSTEIRNKFECPKFQNSKRRKRKVRFMFEKLDHLDFGFVSNFDIRISYLF